MAPVFYICAIIVLQQNKHKLKEQYKIKQTTQLNVTNPEQLWVNILPQRERALDGGTQVSYGSICRCMLIKF